MSLGHYCVAGPGTVLAHVGVKQASWLTPGYTVRPTARGGKLERHPWGHSLSPPSPEQHCCELCFLRTWLPSSPVRPAARAYLGKRRGVCDGFLAQHLRDVDEPHASQVVLVLPSPVQAVVHQTGHVFKNVGAQRQLRGRQVVTVRCWLRRVRLRQRSAASNR